MSDEGLKEIKNSRNSTLHTLEKRTARHLTNMMLWNGGDAHLYIVFSTFSSGELNWTMTERQQNVCLNDIK